MEDFLYRGKIVHCNVITGEVLDSNKFMETHVSAQGGGGNIGRHGGYIQKARIDSSSITHHEFWIKTEDGIERHIKLRGFDIPLRPGQKITLVTVQRKGFGYNWYAALVNHNAQKHWFMDSAEGLSAKLGLAGFSGIYACVGMIAAGGITYATAPIRFGEREWEKSSWEIAVGVFVFFTFYALTVTAFKKARACKKLQSHLAHLVQRVYDNNR